MARAPIILLALLIAGNVRGAFATFSGTQSVTAAGSVFLHQYSSNYSFTADSGSVGESITLTDPNPDQYGYSGVTAYFGTSANLTTGQGAGVISCSSQVQAGGYGPFDQSGGGGNGNASSLYQVNFSVSSPQPFQMSVDSFNPAPPGFPSSDFSYGFTLTSASQGFIGGWSSQSNPAQIGGDMFSGVLEPGDTYTFLDSMAFTGSVEDPFSETGALGADLSLTFVPEPTSGWLLIMGGIWLAIFRLLLNVRWRV